MKILDEIKSWMRPDTLLTPTRVSSVIECRTVMCKCECGKYKEVLLSKIRHVMSCGCLDTVKKKLIRNKYPKALTHVYHGMITRCSRYQNEKYFKKGVRVCDEWRSDINSFCEWALLNGWEKGLHIDKDIKYKEKFGTKTGMIYSPDFCTFVTPKQNANCTSKSVYVFINGLEMTVSQYSEMTGISRNTIFQRLKRGLSNDEAIYKSDIDNLNLMKTYFSSIEMPAMDTEEYKIKIEEYKLLLNQILAL